MKIMSVWVWARFIETLVIRVCCVQMKQCLLHNVNESCQYFYYAYWSMKIDIIHISLKNQVKENYIYIYPFSIPYDTHNILWGATGTKGSVIVFWSSTTEFKFWCHYNGNQQAHFLNQEYSCKPRETWCSEAGTHKMSTQPEQQSQQWCYLFNS